MGATMSVIQRMRFWKKELRIVMVGLDMAGKTTILYKLKLGQIVENHATIVFNMETVEYNDVDFLVFDVPRRETIEPIWRNHCFSAQGLIFVVDSNDRERIIEARDELHRMLKEPELRNEAALLVFANKQDLQNVLSVSDIILKLDLHSLHPRRWYVQAACATSGEGLYEGLNWLSNNILS